MADHTHLAKLYQLVTNQQQEIAALRTEQQMGFATLHQQFQELQRSSIDEQRGVLAEHAREQRIPLITHIHVRVYQSGYFFWGELLKVYGTVHPSRGSEA